MYTVYNYTIVDIRERFGYSYTIVDIREIGIWVSNGRLLKWCGWVGVYTTEITLNDKDSSYSCLSVFIAVWRMVWCNHVSGVARIHNR